MLTGELPIEVPAPSSFFPKPIGNLLRPLEPQLQRFFMPEGLTRILSRANKVPGGAFAGMLLRDLQIDYEMPQEDMRRIPTGCSAVVVANHPFGFLEGLILLDALPRIRGDFRIVVNSLLSSLTQLRDRFIFVNPFSSKDIYQNATAVRECYEWIRSGGLLVIFPAGEVAHLNWGEHFVADPKWNDTAARFARKANCPTVPLFFGGSNSIPFQMIGTIYPGLRTLNLPRELMKKRCHTIQVRVGSPISGAVLRNQKDPTAASDYLRARVYLLSSRVTSGSPAGPKSKSAPSLIAEGDKTDRVAEEIAALPADRLLASSDDFEVYLASAAQIPNTILEIGRCREMTFREAGEGTHNSVDIDRFDSYYHHLFLWSRRDRQIAGAYRIAATCDVLPTHGPKGFYTSTLFQYSPQFFDKLGNAFELGRSFIRSEYQKHYAPLLLLWKGIARCVERRPDCPVLFGAVSISSDYHPLSRALIVNFMTGRMATDLADHVKARRSYRGPVVLPKHIKQLNCLVSTLDELSATVSDIESDGKGVPVLLRHYLKLGGQFLGFNVDPNFSNTLDGLIFADMRTAPAPMLDRCMERSGAAAFRAWHSLPGNS
jgi:putative hemolysin